MKRALTASEMRALDRQAVESQGMPISVLMENAGSALAEAAMKGASAHGRFLVFAGPGNNGGDGLVAARKLAGAGRTVFVEPVVPSGSLAGEAQRNWNLLKATSAVIGTLSEEFPVGPGDVVIDALLGTGLSRPPDEAFEGAIRKMSAFRAAGAKVLACDVPSGLQSDTGQPYGTCVRADATVAFAALKVGQILEPGAGFCGDLRVADIGIPQGAVAALKGPAVFLLEESDVSARLPLRKTESHKGSMGHVLLLAGSRGKSGAAALSARAALRGGAGLVTVATRPNALSDVLAHFPEAMGLELPNEGELSLADLNVLLEAAEGKQAMVIGPGLARGPETAKVLSALMEELAIPCVLDADGLNAFTGQVGLLNKARCPLLLTPHPGEMARLLVRSTSEIQQDRLSSARALCAQVNAVVVLKGARTVIAKKDGTAFINPTGNAGMATAGAGDVLAGLCGALLAQGLSAEDAALMGVYAHGLAGDLAVQKTGQAGLLASDVVDALGEVWVRWNR